MMDFQETTDWLGQVFHPIAARSMLAAGQPPAPQIELAQALLAARPISHALLQKAFAQIFNFAYPYNRAYDLAHASAMAFAAQNSLMINDAFGAAETHATYSAETNTDANRRFATNANALVHARLAAPSRNRQKEFGRRFGRLRALPVDDIDGDDPEMVLVKATQDSRFVAGESWHTDGTASKEPAFGQMLYLKEMPKSGCGGDTMFGNMHLAYEMRAPKMKSMLEELTAIHDGAVPWKGYEAPPNLPKIEHPVVARHSETGQKMLFVNPGFTTRILQLADFESTAILEALFSLADREHALSCRVQWQENTLVFRDNHCSQHRAIWDYFPNKRYAERVTILGRKISREAL